MTQVIMIGLLVGLAFWRRDIILYLIAGPVLIATGLSWFDSYGTPAGFMMSQGIILLGVYSFGMGVWNMIKGGGE